MSLLIVCIPAERAQVTHVVGATTLGGGKACGGRDGFETIFRHHFGMPTGHQHVLAANETNRRALGQDGNGGLLGQYWDNQDLTGPPKLNRTDYAPSFHWYDPQHLLQPFVRIPDRRFLCAGTTGDRTRSPCLVLHFLCAGLAH